MSKSLKQILPMSANYAIKHFLGFLNQGEPKFAARADMEKRVFFLDTPSYGNLGDQAIAYAMRKFVGDILPGYEQFEICEDELPSRMRWLKANIKPKDVICLTGGGNMGVMYQRYESVRRVVIKCFRKNKIIIFPQTIDYGNGFYGKAELKRAVKLYSKAENLTLAAREERSYNKMTEMFRKNHVVFCPDIVLYLDFSNMKQEQSRNVCGICIRDDEEGVTSISTKGQIKKAYPEAVGLTTGGYGAEMITEENRESVIVRKLREFAACDLVITDRLHGVIFSYITNTPCIALPNSNGKVEGVCKWLDGMVRVQNGTEDFCCSFEKTENKCLSDKFGELKRAILD